VRQLVRGDFNDFDFGAGNPGDTSLIQLDQGRDYCCYKTMPFLVFDDTTLLQGQVDGVRLSHS
jgi:hypothetical protein